MIKCKLGELLKIKHGYAFKSENYVDKSNYALVTLANISETNNFKFNYEKTTFYGAEFPNEFILKTGDLIMPLTEQVIGLIGNSAFVPKINDLTFVLNQRVGKVIYNENKVNKYYLHYLLATQIVKEQLEYRASGTKQRNISPENVYDVTVYIPELEVQNKIGTTLYNIENKINNNNKIIAELESMAKTLYDYWFLQYEFPNEEGKPYKSSGGKMVYNEELKREIPENWKCQTINDVVDMVQGYAFSNRDYSSKGIYKLYTIKNVQDGEIVSKVDNKIKKIPSNMSNECMLKPLDIIMSLTGNVGRVGLVYENNALLNQRVLKIKPKNNNILYTYLLFRDVNMKLKLEKISTGTSQKNLSPVDMGNLKCLVPDNQTLNKFQLNNRIIQTIVNLKMENEELINLRDYLLPLLMNGQVSFKN